MSIFISIASYRDPELVSTIRDCLAKAHSPGDIRIGVCWQHSPEEAIDQIARDKRIEIIDCDWRESKGACWARAEIMKFWRGEDYYLQLDSHHRFVNGWDVKLLDQIKLAQSPKPIITTYCQGYDSRTGAPLSCLPTKIVFDRFTADGLPMYRPVSFTPSSESLGRPIRSRFVSAHFLFAVGSFVREVEYDPHLYFHGEEISLAVRAYTWGYEFFHPLEPILFHQYSRDGRAKHWSDHTDQAVEIPWHERDRLSRDRIAKFLADPWVGRFGCGSNRTPVQYQEYAGIDFRLRTVQDYTLLGKEPPNPREGTWRQVQTHLVGLEIERSRIPADLAHVTAWRIILADSEGRELHQAILEGQVLADLLASDYPTILVQLQVESISVPNTWVICSVNDVRERYQIAGECNLRLRPQILRPMSGRSGRRWSSHGRRRGVQIFPDQMPVPEKFVTDNDASR
jgi:Glycosyltransferase (GlcNAc)